MSSFSKKREEEEESSSSSPRRSSSSSKKDSSPTNNSAGKKKLTMTITETPKQSSTIHNNDNNGISSGGGSRGKSGTMMTSFQTPQKTAAATSPLVTSSMTPLYENETRQYYKSMELMMTTTMSSVQKWDTTLGRNYDDDTKKNTKAVATTPGSFLSSSSNKWTVRVGDLACVRTIIQPHPPLHNATTTTTTNSNNQQQQQQQQHCHHYSYQPIQILSIYQERQKNKLSTNKKLSSSHRKKKRYTKDVFVEIRYFYKKSDLDERNQRYYDSSSSSKNNNMNHNGEINEEEEDEEVLESDRVEVVHASFLLGRLVLKSINNNNSNNSYNNLLSSTTTTKQENDNDENASVPTVTMTYNHRLYLHQEQDVLHFNPMEDITDALLLRGIQSSHIMRKDDKVKVATCNFLNIMTSDNNYNHDDNHPEKEGEGGVVEQDAVVVVVTLPPPTFTLQQPNVDMLSSSSSSLSSSTKNITPNKRSSKPSLSSLPSPDKTNENTSIATTTTTTTTTHYYPSCQIQYPISPTIHPYESPPITWNTSIVSKRLLEIASDESRRTCEEILEGNQEEVGYNFLTLLGPIRIDNGMEKMKKSDDMVSSSSLAASGAALRRKTQFVTQNRRTINSTIYCDESSQPKQIIMSPQKRGIITSSSVSNIFIDGLIDRGIEASRLWVSRHSQRKVYREAVMRSRKERDDGRLVTMDDNHAVSTTSASIPSQKIPDSCLQKQLLFNQSSPDIAAVATVASKNTTTTKERRSKRGKSPVVKAKSETKATKTCKQTKHDDVAAGGNDKSASSSIPSQKTPDSWSQKQKLFHHSPAAAATIPTVARRSKRGLATVADAEPETKPKKQKKQSTSTKNELTFPPKDETHDEVVPPRVIKCTKQPFHVDVSSQKSFYDEMYIQPPFDSYDDRFFSTKKNGDNEQQLWKVRLGDMVCIDVENHQKADLVTFPFAVTWSPAEIVSIYRVHSNKAECLKLREKLQSGDQKLNNDVDDDPFDVMVEVRWFYRKHEIPGAGSKSSKLRSNDDDELEEIFETDQIDSCPAECLLSPVKLYEVSRPEESLPSVVSGMPCIYYHCRRYWSIHRKSFVPSGLLSNRIERGRMHSEYKAALSKLPSASASNGKKSSEGYSWKEGFQSAIQKLSLAEAAADVQVHGMELRCRERERKHIGSFLRKAIRGLEQRTNNTQDDDNIMRDDEGPMNTKSSIFICGPPGTGKTASVRSIINELQEEQASGNLPEFNFIALNGMEMRSPFDSYVKFWEALSGTRKERLSAGAAAAKLEEYFGDGQKDETNEDRLKKPITVLMLDEIDYLVTKKQTILYNFFDWPLRATNARLIVIGISNTINLPERLSLKLQSRLGGERCHFKSYTVDETVAILKTRLDGDASEVFDEDAIKFASRKTGNLSGDIRKAFHMCKVAAQNALDDYSTGRRRVVEGSHPKVKISDVQRGSRDMYTSIIHKAISCSSSYEALVLIAIGALKKSKVGKDIVSLDVQEMLTKIESIANGSGEERYLSARLSLGDLLGILSRLGDVSTKDMMNCFNLPR
ncbi:hypothetical protein ACHAXM_003855 [Skeletonema potamos]